MRLKFNNRIFLIEQSPSIHVSRNNAEIKLNDVTISVNDTWGGKGPDGKYYRTVAKYAQESKEIIRSYSALPEIITLPLMEQWGFFN